MARSSPIPLEQREADYAAAVARADDVMPRWLEARACGPVPVALEAEAREAEADVRRAAGRLERARHRLI